jgi:hypothetical protein
VINLLLAIGLILFVLWVLGLITSYTLGGYAHTMFIIAIICIVVWFIMRRRR